MPECDIFLFELAIYLARAPKNNLVYTLSHEVKDDVKKY
jgi:replication-associated recombination protein RarA